MFTEVLLFFCCTCLIVYGHYQNVDVNSCRVGLKLSCGEDEETSGAGINDDHSQIQGRQGKRGPQGVQGPVGRPGLKGSKGEPCSCEHQLSGFENRMRDLEARPERSQLMKCPRTKFKFPREDQTTDWIRVKVPIPRITALTVCSWIIPPTSSGVKGGFVSYATLSSDNEFLLFFSNRNRLEVYIKGTSQGISINTKSHLCVVASPVEGWSKVYTNGRILSRLTYASRQLIEGGGAFIIGQEQDSFAGSFAANQAFGGTIENFMVWYRVLGDSEIQALFEDHCNCPRDYSISLAPDQIQFEGRVASLPTGQC